MHVERVLAVIKGASPGKQPHVERVIAGGHLAIVRQAFHSAGGCDRPGLFTSKEVEPRNGDERQSYMSELQSRTLKVAARLWLDLQIPSFQFPFLLCKIVDVRASPE